MIYSLKNTKNPIIKFENSEFHTTDYSFDVKMIENKTVFVLQSIKDNSHYKKKL